MIPGDIAPQLAHLTGWVELQGKCLTIHARRPGPATRTGSVNYTRLELM